MRRYAAKVDGVRLGRLCKNGHDWAGMGMSKRDAAGHCVSCAREALVKRMRDPEKLAAWRDTQKRRSARWIAAHKRSAKPRERTMTLDRRREICRLSKVRARKRNPSLAKSRSRAYYAANSVRISLRNRIYRALRRQGIRKVSGPSAFRADLQGIIQCLGPCPGPRREWHIDHIRPLSSFDLSDPAQVRAAFAPSNHQWLLAAENLRKGAKYA